MEGTHSTQDARLQIFFLFWQLWWQIRSTFLKHSQKWLNFTQFHLSNLLWLASKLVDYFGHYFCTKNTNKIMSFLVSSVGFGKKLKRRGLNRVIQRLTDSRFELRNLMKYHGLSKFVHTHFLSMMKEFYLKFQPENLNETESWLSSKIWQCLQAK